MKELLQRQRLLPLATLHDQSEAEHALAALAARGLSLLEIALRSDYALLAIKAVRERCPSVTVGAGTVLTALQAEAALEAGAQFLVSPGFSEGVLRVCRERGVFYLPGCVTPTEIMRAADAGLEVLKFFPAQVYGGAAALKALAAPFPHIKFVPTGGVNLSNLGEYLSLSNVLAAGGAFVLEGDAAEHLKYIHSITEGAT